MDYQPDGRPLERSLREELEDLMESVMIAADLAGEKQFARAVAEALRLIEQRMGEQVSRDWYRGNGDHASDLRDWDEENEETGYDEEPVDIEDGPEEDEEWSEEGGTEEPEGT